MTEEEVEVGVRLWWSMQQKVIQQQCGYGEVMPSHKEIEAAISAVILMENKRCGKESDMPEETYRFWRRRVVAALLAAESMRAAMVAQSGQPIKMDFKPSQG